MTRPVVRCRCGHRVLAKEVLRTDLYERPSGREYVYVKYRCKRCKRLGETFVAESRWDWRIFETSRSEMSEAEVESFASQAPISSEDIVEFHRQLAALEETGDLGLHDFDSQEFDLQTSAPESSENTEPDTLETPTAEAPPDNILKAMRPENLRPETLRPDSKRDFKNENKPDTKKNETKGEPKPLPGESTHHNHPQCDS